MRIFGALLIAAGAIGLLWVVVVWRWQDPLTAFYTHFQQDNLDRALKQEFADFRPPAVHRRDLAAERRTVALEAARFRRATGRGQPIGRIVIGRIGLNMVLVNGTDEESLKSGPGRDLRSFMPGQNRLVYIAGHRTTYLAPFAHIDSIRVGDVIRLAVPYGTFTYRMTRHAIVPSNDLAVLRSPRHDLLELQACHPRFFATHRYIVYARLVAVQPRDSRPYALSALAAASS